MKVRGVTEIDLRPQVSGQWVDQYGLHRAIVTQLHFGEVVVLNIGDARQWPGEFAEFLAEALRHAHTVQVTGLHSDSVRRLVDELSIAVSVTQ